MDTTFQLFINGILQHPKKIHSAIYAEELYEEMKKIYIPGTHIRLEGTASENKKYTRCCTIREHLWNKKTH